MNVEDERKLVLNSDASRRRSVGVLSQSRDVTHFLNLNLTLTGLFSSDSVLTTDCITWPAYVREKSFRGTFSSSALRPTMSTSNSSQPASALPLSQLEGLRHRAEQIIESIQVLGGAIELGNAPAMYPWPDLLARYNLLLSQTLNFSNSLAAAVPQPPGQRPV